MRLVVWGLGRHAITKILPAVSMVSGLELHGVCSRNIDTVNSVANTWGCIGWNNPDLMLSDPEVDIVFLATPIGLHYIYGKKALDAKKHFWCEKSLTCRLEDSLELLSSASEKRLSICEGQMFLYHPQYQRLIEYIQSLQFGNILSIDCKFGIPRLENGGFRSDPALGGGAFFDVGSYPIAAILGLFPQAKAGLNYARVSSDVGSLVDTNGQAIVNFSNGVAANLEWGINRSYRNEIVIWGDKGSIFTSRIFSKPSDHQPIFYLRDTQGIESTEYGVAGDHFQLMFREFLGTIYDLKKAELERMQIKRRAVLMDQIWSLGRSE